MFSSLIRDSIALIAQTAIPNDKQYSDNIEFPSYDIDIVYNWSENIQ